MQQHQISFAFKGRCRARPCHYLSVKDGSSVSFLVLDSNSGNFVSSHCSNLADCSSFPNQLLEGFTNMNSLSEDIRVDRLTFGRKNDWTTIYRINCFLSTFKNLNANFNRTKNPKLNNPNSLLVPVVRNTSTK